MALTFDAHSAAGRLARTTIGLATVATSGTRLILVACAPLVFINGLPLSAFPVNAGRHIPIGTDRRGRFLLKVISEISLLPNIDLQRLKLPTALG